MHILLVADGRSPITAGWLRMLRGLGYRISLISTFPCGQLEDANLVAVLPVGFASLAGGQTQHAGSSANSKRKEFELKRRLIGAFRPTLLNTRAWLGPLTLGKFQTQLLGIVDELKPDIVHALRIPFEGMLAQVTPKEIPFLVSIWGNDLTLHARTSPLMGTGTRRALARADGLLADARRDIRLAKEWGLREEVPTLVVPGSGGLDFGKIREAIKNTKLPFNLPAHSPLVVNPRGFRPGSVHQETFFQSLPLVLEQVPDAFFVCPAMQGQQQAEKWIRKFNIRDHVLLLPYLSQEQLWRLYACSQVYVSLSSHDGTPNTFLEALACGCFPVVGDIESLREWVKDGENGLLVDPRDAHAAAHTICRAIREEKLRKMAQRENHKLVSSRAEVDKVREQVADFLSAFQ